MLEIRGAGNKDHDFCFEVTNKSHCGVIAIEVQAQIVQNTKNGKIEWTSPKETIFEIGGWCGKRVAYKLSDFRDCGKPLKVITDKDARALFLTRFVENGETFIQLDSGDLQKCLRTPKK